MGFNFLRSPENASSATCSLLTGTRASPLGEKTKTASDVFLLTEVAPSPGGFTSCYVKRGPRVTMLLLAFVREMSLLSLCLGITLVGLALHALYQIFVPLRAWSTEAAPPLALFTGLPWNYDREPVPRYDPDEDEHVRLAAMSPGHRELEMALKAPWGVLSPTSPQFIYRRDGQSGQGLN